MRLTFAILFALFILLSCSIGQAAESDPFFFVQLADTQLGMASGNKDLSPEIDNFTQAVQHINRLKPAFVVISGDLVNQAHDIKQIRAFWNVAREIDPSIPLHLLPGNHDVNQPTKESVVSYRKLFGPDYYSFFYHHSEFVVLNSCLVCDPGADADLRAAQRKWFEQTLASAREKNADHIFVCTHHSWFLDSPDEDDNYFQVPKTQRFEYLELMVKFGVHYALAGHYHRNAIARDGSLEMITSASIGKALGDDPVGLRVFKVYSDRVEHEYYPLDQVPEQIKL